MLNVSYENRIGYFTAIQGERKYKLHICHANCLCAMINFYTDENGEDMAQLASFFMDMQHAKNCIKGNVCDDWNDFVFNAKECDTEMWKLIRLLADNGKNIRIK